MTYSHSAPMPRTPAPSPWLRAATFSGGFVALLFVIELIDTLLNQRFNQAGIRPLDSDGLSGILVAPLIHYDWAHLVANSVPLLVLGFLVFLGALRRAITATAIIWIVGGAGTWLIGGSGVHIGASIIVFGWLAFLVAQGFFSRNAVQIAVGVAVVFLYGGLFWGVLPGQPNVSWQGHLFGAIGGLVAAWYVTSHEREQRRAARQRPMPRDGMTW
ncbi:rhomboid family intramembrane serine protease [Hoyosella sp. G463]|uniref:Rhomboid family intramembrane serine protease n=1 Tax=Lolliginicoccus lacisalsi TaxID=2742202 RepID=A0A927JB44_9ACTN|nr:rhomboid family intramembrane serine protease [Lolliginicoccus lacisalsi]MBD8506034.1 rhomboid family intramembrane serine protease [Lolliginicoccus lacisalsi]